MSRTHARAASLALGIITVLSVSGCASSDDDTAAPSESPTATLFDQVPEEFRDGLLVASQANLAPLTFVDDAGDLTGLNVDLLDALSNVLGVEITLEPVTFENLILGLESGRYDFVADTTIREDRMLKYDQLSNLYSSYSVGTLATADPIGDEETDICGLNMGVVSGASITDYVLTTIDAACAEEGLEQIVLVEYPDFATQILATESGNIDGALVDTMTFGYFLTSDQGAKFDYNGPTRMKLSPSGYSFMKTQGGALADVVTEALTQLWEDGTYAAIFASYGLDESALDGPPVLNPDLG